MSEKIDIFDDIKRYHPEYDYNPTELLFLAVFTKEPLPDEAVEKIEGALKNALDKLPIGRWELSCSEITTIYRWYLDAESIPKQLEKYFAKLFVEYSDKIKYDDTIIIKETKTYLWNMLWL